MIYRNPTREPIAFRDDAGKRMVEPGASFVLTGDQHAPLAELTGLVRAPDPEPIPADATLAELNDISGDLGIKPASRRKADVRAAVVAVTGETSDEGEAD